jgi:hypothetical protein
VANQPDTCHGGLSDSSCPTTRRLRSHSHPAHRMASCCDPSEKPLSAA